ncbi:hypothetical protein E2562_028695 [Oryza meyeriana var. granulata]|uniref:Uncharacterized protein n=1 Tax=Oryza meyeriana var. granulata TaxID=110450 RepID=A0A6G1CKQ4_9ORYZ|nr:hypothetical protein E2562_028695 [Oryza meyeriana var. granulata]
MHVDYAISKRRRLTDCANNRRKTHDACKLSMTLVMTTCARLGGLLNRRSSKPESATMTSL